jgi:membrane protease YdiL (CAAX protease family)
VAVLASAAVFAVVHPPVSMLPVFVLGLLAALSYERTRLLYTPIMVHAVYNAGVMLL